MTDKRSKWKSFIDRQYWDRRFLNLAQYISEWSKDPSTKCGAVIIDNKKRILSVGYNGFPQGTDDNPIFYNTRPKKMRRVIHAEENALLFAQRDLEGCTIFTYPFLPCSTCAAKIIQCGIKLVISIYTEDRDLRGRHSVDETYALFEEAGVSAIEYPEHYIDATINS